MEAGSRQSPPLRIVIGDIRCEVTNMAGHTISYLKKVCAENLIFIPGNAGVSVFTMKSPAENDEAVTERNESILTREMDGGLQILHGLMLRVRDSYVISPEDVMIEFK